MLAHERRDTALGYRWLGEGRKAVGLPPLASNGV
jgi:hypothetical protein